LATEGDQAQGLGDRRHDELRVANGSKGNEADAVSEGIGEVGRDVEGEAGLADAAGTGQGDEGDIFSEQQPAQRRAFPLSPDERCPGQREIGGAIEQG
jgi:hypothetical protein